ncbi:MAG: hypothetical protein LBE12_03765 [Planctomycetaceae bacterium]|nr:hypothetical protein [Planctomycetaceae bacterium]
MRHYQLLTINYTQLVGFSLPSVNRVKSAIADVMFCRYIAYLWIIHVNNNSQNAEITRKILTILTTSMGTLGNYSVEFSV